MKSTSKRIISLLASALLFATMLLSCVACGEKEIQGIEITTPPTKIDYIVGEKFDPAGMVVSVVYAGEDGKKEVLDASAYTLSPSATDALETKNRNVTVTYEKDGKTYTAKQSITVHNNVTKAVIKSNPTKTSYMPGEAFDPTGMVVTATYEDGSTKDVEITSSNAQFKTEGLAKEDENFVVKFGGIELTIELTIQNGIFIEAETGIIEAKSYQIKNDAVDKDGNQTASGGLYVGNMFAGESITFKFVAASAGKADIAFILASLYLKRDNNWTPIEMGDCQFNKIVEFTVNDVKYEIPDSAILPGGVAEDQEAGDQTLWFNWKEVVFENIDIKAGTNSIKLTFIPHDYKDTSQASFSGSFTANIDCLRVTSDVACSAQTYDFTVTDSYVEKSGDKVLLNISGTAEGYDKSSFTVEFATGVTMPFTEYNVTSSNAFTAKVDLSKLPAGTYDAISLVTSDNSKPLTTTKEGGSFSDAISEYTVSKAANGNLKIEVVGGVMYKVTGITLEVIDGKPCYVITGDVNGYKPEDFVLDYQENQVWAGNAGTFTMTINEAEKTFRAVSDLSALKASNNVYIPHFKLTTESGDGAGDIKVENGVTAQIGQSIKANGNIYTLDDSAFGCVCVKIVSEKNFENKSVSLEVKDGKPYLVINGEYAQYEKAELEAALTEKLYADTQNMPKVDADDTSDAWDDATITALESGKTVFVEVADDGTYKIYLDLSAGKVGQALFSHFSLTGATNSNLANLTKSETANTITVDGKKYSFVDMSSMAGEGDAWSWATTLIVVLIEAAS